MSDTLSPEAKSAEQFASFTWDTAPNGMPAKTRLDVYRHALFSEPINQGMVAEIVQRFELEVMRVPEEYVKRHWTCRPYDLVGEGKLVFMPATESEQANEPPPKPKVLLPPNVVTYTDKVGRG